MSDAQPDTGAMALALRVEAASGAEFLLVKRGLYYGPDNCGYTGVRDRAGRYHESDASPEHGITAIYEHDAPLFAPACWNDVKVSFLLDRIAELEDALKDRAHGQGGDGR